MLPDWKPTKHDHSNERKEDMKVFGQRVSVFKLSLLVFILFITSSCLFIYYLDVQWTTNKINLNESGKNRAQKYKHRNEKIVLQQPKPEYSASSKKPQQMNSKNEVQESVLTKGSKTPEPTNLPVNYDVHIFYYPWYGNPEHDGKYFHWNHPYLPHWDKIEAAKWPSGQHVPPDDIGANFYPQLGPYSSEDPVVVEDHMKQVQLSGAGTVCSLNNL